MVITAFMCLFSLDARCFTVDLCFVCGWGCTNNELSNTFGRARVDAHSCAVYLRCFSYVLLVLLHLRRIRFADLMSQSPSECPRRVLDVRVTPPPRQSACSVRDAAADSTHVINCGVYRVCNVRELAWAERWLALFLVCEKFFFWFTGVDLPSSAAATATLADVQHILLIVIWGN